MTVTLPVDEIRRIASEHERARRERTPLRRPTLTHPSMTIEDAYACQQAWIELQQADGSHVVGHKVGLTSRAMQSAMGIDEPDFGTLLAPMLREHPADFVADDWLDPRLEVELAFVLDKPLPGASTTRDDVLTATGSVVAALELIDARSHRIDPDDGEPRTVRDTIADNAASAAVVVGEVRLPVEALDLRWAPAILKVNGDVVETGVAAGVLDDPVMSVVWLARRLAGYGVALDPGELILSGSFTRPVPCRAGDRFDADFRELGVVSCRFT